MNTTKKKTDLDYMTVAEVLSRDLPNLVSVADYIDDSSPLFEVQNDRSLLSVNLTELISEISSVCSVKTSLAVDWLRSFKFWLRDNGKHFSQDQISILGFADEPGYCWTRLPFTKADTANIKQTEIPEFLEFCSRINEGGEYLQWWLGSLLDPHSDRAQYLHLQGAGGDGKSVLLSALQDVFGNHMLRPSAQLFLGKHYGAEMEGCRLLVFADENNATFTASGKFKQVTGETHFTVEEKFKSTRTIMLGCKVLITSNPELEIAGTAANLRRAISLSIRNPQEDSKNNDLLWGSRFRDSIFQILGYCYNLYKQLPANMQKMLPSPQESLRAAVMRNIAEEMDALYCDFEVTGNPHHTINRAEISTAVKKRLGTIPNYKLKEIWQTLEAEGVTQFVHQKGNWLRGIRKRNNSEAVILAAVENAK
ncbi:MAG TPA: primase-helicase family protein [Allocoleopsis sp.]